MCVCFFSLHCFPCPGLLLPPATSLFCLCSLSFHSLGWLGLLFAEGKHQAALWSLFWFFPIVCWNGVFGWNRKNVKPWPGAPSARTQHRRGGIPLSWAWDGRSDVSLQPSA